MGGSGGGRGGAGGARAGGPSEGINLVGLCCGVALKHRLSLSNATGMFICLQYVSRLHSALFERRHRTFYTFTAILMLQRAFGLFSPWLCDSSHV